MICDPGIRDTANDVAYALLGSGGGLRRNWHLQARGSQLRISQQALTNVQSVRRVAGTQNGRLLNGRQRPSPQRASFEVRSIGYRKLKTELTGKDQ